MIEVEALYRKFGPMVLRRCRRLLGNEHRALDAMQETFVRVLRFEQRLTDEAPSSLLYRIATNVSLNMRRSERRRGAEQSDSVDREGIDLIDALAAASDGQAQGVARRLLTRIFRDEQERTLLLAVLHYVDGLTLEEVAAECDMSVSGVRKRLRGLKQRANQIIAAKGERHVA